MRHKADLYPPGSEAPVVITPRAVVRLVRRTTAVLRRKTRA